MLITLTIRQNNMESIDIRVPSNQCIHNTLQILYENHFLCLNPDERKYRVSSWRMGKTLNGEISYEENAVFTADILDISDWED